VHNIVRKNILKAYVIYGINLADSSMMRYIKYSKFLIIIIIIIIIIQRTVFMVLLSCQSH